MVKFISALLRVPSRLGSSATKTIPRCSRTFLSDSFQCRDAWNHRLQTETLRKINPGDLFFDIDVKLQSEGNVSAIDVDLFVNSAISDDLVDEIDNVLHRFRLSQNTMYTLPSTHHAVIRLLLDLGKYEQLLDILNDRINYGIFPDYYCSCLMMDKFLKENKSTYAAKVATFQMLQEDWSDTLTSLLALYSCHMYLTNPSTDLWEKPVVEEEDSGEEIKIRVKYLRNPYFDDHFDLKDPKLLVGKTLSTLGKSMSGSIGDTYQLVGWGLYKKWDKAITHLQNGIKNKQKLYSEGVKFFEQSIESLTEDENSYKEQIIKLLQEIKTSNLLLEDELMKVVAGKVEALVKEVEPKMINEQHQLYDQWEKVRYQTLQEELNKLKIAKRLLQVQKEKEELSKKEEELFFFDNEDKIDLLIDKNEEITVSLQTQRKKKTKVTEEEYIPPEVRQTSV